MESEFNSASFVEEGQEHEIPLGASGRFVFAKKRIYGRMHFLKRPSEEYKNDLITVESLQKEFAIGYSLDHPNIVKYHRFENNTLFEEYIDGKSLRELIDGKDLRLSDKHFLQSLCLQFLDVLRYLRAMGVVHNDIKPENVIVSRIGNTLKLVDFNCAQSSTNDILGGFTDSYRAPEQASGAIESSSDLYQVGKVMEELCARAGYIKNWRRFIKATTAKNCNNRVSIEEAETLIPRRHNIKQPAIAILLVIALTAVAVTIFTPVHTETMDVREVNPVKDTIFIEKVEQPSEENVKGKKEKSEVDIRKVIDNKISNYTESYYKTFLYPICRESLENGNRRLTIEEETALQKAIKKAYDSAENYGDELSAQYPEERNYIEKECLHSFERKISSLLLKVYPPEDARSTEASE